MDEVMLDPSLSQEMQGQIIDLLKANKDCFAWSHEDMTGISPDVIMHKLNVDPDHKSIKQKRRKFAPERNQIINDEFQKLIGA